MKRKKISIKYYFNINNDNERLKYFSDVLFASMPYFLNSDANLDKFQLVWREDIIGIKYVDDLKFLLNDIRVQANVEKYGNVMNAINYFGEKGTEWLNH